MNFYCYFYFYIYMTCNWLIKKYTKKNQIISAKIETIKRIENCVKWKINYSRFHHRELYYMCREHFFLSLIKWISRVNIYFVTYSLCLFDTISSIITRHTYNDYNDTLDKLARISFFSYILLSMINFAAFYNYNTHAN